MAVTDVSRGVPAGGVSATQIGVAVPLSAAVGRPEPGMLRVAVLLPDTCGLNCTVIVQFDIGPTGTPEQLSVSLNDETLLPLSEADDNAAAATSPLFEIVNVPVSPVPPRDVVTNV